jgi:hypothetical protein
MTIFASEFVLAAPINQHNSVLNWVWEKHAIAQITLRSLREEVIQEPASASTALHKSVGQ